MFTFSEGRFAIAVDVMHACGNFRVDASKFDSNQQHAFQSLQLGVHTQSACINVINGKGA